MKNRFSTLTLLLVLALSGAAQAADIQFPDEELPSETVTPILDSPSAVMGRALEYNRRIEANLYTGWLLDEPFYSNQYFGVKALYHIGEIHSFGFQYATIGNGLSSYSQQFKSDENLNISWAPGPKSMMAFVYEHQAFYGKISFTKGYVAPLTISGLVDFGLISYGSKSYPLIAGGVAHKLFFNNHWGMNLTLKAMLHQALDPLSQPLVSPPATKPSEGSFSTKTEFTTMMDLTAIYLF